LNIPDSCKWNSKKRGRKALEQNNHGEEEEGEGGEIDDKGFAFSSQVDLKHQPQPNVKDNLAIVEESQKQKSIIDYSPKRSRTTIDSSDPLLDDDDDNSRVEIKKTFSSTKNIDLLYTNKLLELKRRIWSEDLSKDESERIIKDFEAFRRTYLPQILSKQSKDKLRETDARIIHLIDKWNIDINYMSSL
jgi:hypothetical protein